MAHALISHFKGHALGGEWIEMGSKEGSLRKLLPSKRGVRGLY